MSGKSLPYLPWYPADYIAATRHLALSERAVYRELLDYQWLMGQLPNDMLKLARMVTISLSEFEAIWPAIADKFEDTETGLFNKRLEEHRNLSLDLKEKQRMGAQKANAKRYGERHSERHSERISNGADTAQSASADRVSVRSPPTLTPTLTPTVGEEPPKPPIKNESKLSFDPSTVENLNLEAFARLAPYRREQRFKALGPMGCHALAKVLSGYPLVVQAAMIDTTIANGWQGVFPLDADKLPRENATVRIKRKLAESSTQQRGVIEHGTDEASD